MINEMKRNLKFPMFLQFFAEEPPAPENEPETSEQPTPVEAEKTPEVKSFTQEELDRTLADRLARERKKYADYDEIKTKMSEYEKQLEEKRLAEMSEIERAKEIASKFETEKQTLAQQLEQLQSQVKAEKIRNAFITAATGANIAHVDDAYRLADLSAVTFDESGNVTGVSDIVQSLVQNKPFLLGAPVKPQTIGNPSNPVSQATTRSSEQLLKEAAEKARATGKLEDMMAYSNLKAELSQ